MKASVLPEPVTAQAHMSLPMRAVGMAADWILVGLVKPIAANALNRQKYEISRYFPAKFKFSGTRLQIPFYSKADD